MDNEELGIIYLLNAVICIVGMLSCFIVGLSKVYWFALDERIRNERFRIVKGVKRRTNW